MNKNNSKQSITAVRNGVKIRGFRQQERVYPDVDRESESLKSGGHLLCSKCNAISVKKHWSIDEHMHYVLSSDPTVHRVVCPGCDALEKEEYEGEVLIKGSLANPFNEGMLGLIKNVADRYLNENPRARMVVLAADENLIRIMTTTKWLAVTIGKEIHKTFKGNLQTKTQPRERFVRVIWTS